MSNALRLTRNSMSLPRCVEPELLDELAADDPRALRSRQDLQRLNWLLGSTSILSRALDEIVGTTEPPHLVELGAGDGSMMLRLAQRRGSAWRGTRLSLLDRQPCVSAQTLAGLRALGWQVEVLAIDVFDWIAQPAAATDSIVIANLFVHHFAGQDLERLLAGIARRARAFACCEPRRSRLALAGSHLLGVIGCNAITRHDAVLSVHAGFRDQELSAVWSPSPVAEIGWRLQEGNAGLFNHLFVARRVGP